MRGAVVRYPLGRDGQCCALVEDGRNGESGAVMNRQRRTADRVVLSQQCRRRQTQTEQHRLGPADLVAAGIGCADRKVPEGYSGRVESLTQGLRVVEKTYGFYTPGKRVKATAKRIGYQQQFTWNDKQNLTWLELRKPGALDSLKGGQTLAKILPKTLAKSK